jgi:hypothetical protein
LVNAIPLKYKEDTVHEEAAEIQGNETEKTSVTHPLNVWCHLKEINIRKFVCQPERGDP